MTRCSVAPIFKLATPNAPVPVSSVSSVIDFTFSVTFGTASTVLSRVSLSKQNAFILRLTFTVVSWFSSAAPTAVFIPPESVPDLCVGYQRVLFFCFVRVFVVCRL